MKSKIQKSNQDIESAANSLQNNEFVVVPAREIAAHREIVPRSLHSKLESMAFGLTANHFAAIVHRTDPRDAPDTVNVDVYLYDYNAAANQVSATGLLVNRAGHKTWHRRNPRDEFMTGITYDNISATAQSFRTSGEKLGGEARQALHDALQFKRVIEPGEQE